MFLSLKTKDQSAPCLLHGADGTMWGFFVVICNVFINVRKARICIKTENSIKTVSVCGLTFTWSLAKAKSSELGESAGM